MLSGHTGNSFLPTYSSATNRMTALPGFTPTYDSNGNVLNDSSHQYTPNVEGRPVTLDSVSLTFDALNRMVEQNSGGSYTGIVYAPTGEKLALMNGQSLQKAFVPLPGGAAAVYTASGLDHYRHTDWLGSVRLASTQSRTVSGDTAYAPFGETYAQSGTPDISFTGQNADTSGGLHDFLFREYSNQGRWAVPDPAGLAAVSLSKPQSWNRYAYVVNNPISFTDPWGLCPDGADDCVTVTADPIDGFGGGAFGGGGGGGGDNANPPCSADNLPDPYAEFLVAGYGLPEDFMEMMPPPPQKGCAGTHAGGRNGSSSGGLVQKIKSAYCSAVPTGRSTSVTVAAGGIGSVSGSVDMVVNYNSGQTSLFATGGGGLGWNGGGSVTATTGLVYGLDSTNNGFSGQFKGGNFYAPTPIPGIGAGGSITHGGGVTVVSAGVSGALAGKYGFGGSWTNTTNPLNAGRFTGFAALDYVGYLLRQPCT